MKKSILSIVLLLTLCFCGTAQADSDYEYTVKDNKVTITKYNGYEWDKTIEELIIPNKINGMKVVGVKKGAFNDIFGAMIIKNVVCSDYMTKVNMKSFAPLFVDGITLGKYTKSFVQAADYRGEITELKKIKLPKKAKYLKMKKGGVYSKNGKTLFAVPALKKGTFKIAKGTKKISDYAFYCSRLDKVVVPKSVKKISKTAFKGFGIFGKGKILKLY